MRDLEVNGHDVMESLGIEPGPKVGTVLEGLLYLVHDERVPNERDALLERVALLAK